MHPVAEVSTVLCHTSYPITGSFLTPDTYTDHCGDLLYVLSQLASLNLILTTVRNRDVCTCINSFHIHTV
jgi:hypothetical protein